MLTPLATVRARLGLLETETQYDALLTSAIQAISARFDHECNRTLARTENYMQEFDADRTEVCAACYPIETVAKFETKTSEAEGWCEVQPAPDYVIRSGCIISLGAPLSALRSSSSLALARVTYSGGYVLPGATPAPGQIPLPDDLQQAAVEQTVFWFQNRERVGVIRFWPKGLTYEQFVDLDLLPNVRAVLGEYRRLAAG